ncbi:G5 domain-containing protein [Alkalibacter rhizosphaerae]|uniref:G5 domain-containing protein n=1 Tax=Alkalibacter rhizosphaerae TaxID=2815577 RepID=A0A975AHQ5_9FIRM|nr:3D domain-containing protein [Alkalibacter rhizosphaerae]QSX07735.1 G5 domain-containing protein [Alkalibacter rhizosphaerae]
MKVHTQRLKDLGKAARNLLILALLVSAMSAAFVIYQTTEEVVTIVDEENTMEYSFRGNKTAGEILSDNDLYLEEMDELSMALSQEVNNGDTIEIKRASDLTVVVDGKEYAFTTAEDQVDRIIKRLGLRINELDIVQPAQGEVIQAGFDGEIRITRVTEEMDVNEYPIKYAKVTRSNANMDKGEVKTIQRGSDGLRSVSEKVVYHDGVEYSRTIVEEVVEREPKEEIKEVGTNVYIATSRGQTRFQTAMYVTATAYCSCTICTGSGNGITASGTRATASRTIAAPSNFRFGTEFYIPYFRGSSNRGIFKVEDRGGAIRGNRIDIYFNSHEEAIRFGRKTLKVYVLD